VQTPSVGGGSAVPVRVKFDRLIAYSTLQLPLAMAALPVVLNVSHFYGEVLKLSFGIMGAIFIIARTIDAIQDPVIGLISDRFTHRGPRGRLIFVALTLPLLLGGFYMLFDPPDSLVGDPGAMAIWLMASLFLVHLGYSGVSISYHAHGAELTDDYNERTKITVGREVFGLIGMTAAVVLPTILTAKLGPERGYEALGLIFLPIALLFDFRVVAVVGPSAGGAGSRRDPCARFPHLDPLLGALSQAAHRRLRAKPHAAHVGAVLCADEESAVPPPAARVRGQWRRPWRRRHGHAVLCRARPAGQQD